ncbi:Phenazine N-monooxygenase PhzNO1 [Exophiala dermatitidis]|uniref:Cyclohexanone monooxygenase n=1 Tax=Exophiala dermatitidis (strain ATCC 34100 / CBS 525.76 / NIH/UT8656) TaxID=858893 RepID=H6C2X0_EXODN|nr:cyclohexanone monooxygenase [Exophiala dermatitidis NIH/UT8656]XP_009158445.1 cyclohexanone monooxygenase, variant 1 [Exophiala dermatitidis NIH/UT8656]XP_009158446.1 cyclohexanone monooxygenase, variant 2 [Exophiala dermatitidis NIH/UT8656]EHY57983.1 cyclohexanone monooxygenase, variant 2 [Exophiala dermatitidis NIH/UT8656]EHY57984.1 cyclohexanone monooxygenase, variant 1 [Exophiala dermatitidis NIH/UT8656]EHY57985.1 cyclohexanone monooxygenase [Exophiala dermatitidis NIH/UT8656]
MGKERTHDALVIGTGFGGLYALYLLKQQGLDVKAIDTASDVGGTWYWNRYPGARSDVESHVYRYSWDKELLLDKTLWTKNYLTQPELESYFQKVARKHDLYRHIQFNTDLVAAHWDNTAKLWIARTSSGDIFKVRYLIGAVGNLYKPNLPDWPGLDNNTFRGQIVHSSQWNPREHNHIDKRVAVVGSGASGVQLVGALAEKAKTLTHFIRHAQFVLPASLRTVSDVERQTINDNYDRIWRQVFTSLSGMGFPEPARTVASVSPEDREAIFQDLWIQGSGFRFLFGGFSDLVTDEKANQAAIDFIHRKIDSIVTDPKKAQVLKSTDWFARRPLTDDQYYNRFNQDNVFAVDLKQTPIVRLHADSIETADGKKHQVDLIVLATGFDAADGTYYRIDIRGKDGTTLKDHWSQGPKTHHGVSTSKFPNLFFVNGPGAPFASNPPVTEEGARFIADLIARAEAHRTTTGSGTDNVVIESTRDAEDAYTKDLHDAADPTLFPRTKSWFFGENIPGRHVAPRFYFGGLSRYRAALADIRERGYAGFDIETTQTVQNQNQTQNQSRTLPVPAPVRSHL